MRNPRPRTLKRKNRIYFYQRLFNYLQYYALDAYEDFEGEDTFDLDTVDILTIHQAKGLEWPVVFVPSLVEGRFPSKYSGQPQDWLIPETVFPPKSRRRYEGGEMEERRLFYVALTRAKDVVYLSRFRKKINQFKPSPFLREIAGGDPPVTRRLPIPGPFLPPADEPEELPTISFSELALYEGCPLRYRFSSSLGFQPQLVTELGYGRAIHHILRHLAENTKKKQELPTAQQVEEIFRDAFYLPFANNAAFYNLFDRARSLVGKYLTDFSSDLLRVWETERAFELHLEKGVVNGRADVILDREGGKIGKLAIVDYKTANDPKTDDIFAFQLAIYAAAGRGERLDVKAAYLHVLKESDRRNVPVDKVAVRVARKRADILIEGIVAGEFPPTRQRSAELVMCGRSASTPSAASMTSEGSTMARQKKVTGNGAEGIDDYRHKEAKRKNNPPAKIAAEGQIPAVPNIRYLYSPRRPPVLRFDASGKADHLPELLEQASKRALTRDEIRILAEAIRSQEPWLEWAGKRETQATGFSVDPVALHIHERISAQAILKVAARQDVQRSLFGDPEQDYHEAVQFYKHDIDWTNRMILGDSLHIMASLAHREDLAGKVQMIYIDPPYGIKYGSNFQPFIGSRDVKDKESDLTRELEMVKAYRDIWHLGVHTYLTYLRDRLILSKEMLADTGSLFVQIGDENVHRVRLLLDEVFGSGNFVNFITFSKTSSATVNYMAAGCDYLLWYARDRAKMKYRQVFGQKTTTTGGGQEYTRVELQEGIRRIASDSELNSPENLPVGSLIYRPDNMTSQSIGRDKGAGCLLVRVDVHTPKANVQCTTLDRKPLKSVRNRHQTNTILNTLHEPKSTTVLELKYRSYEMFTIIQEFTEKYRGFRGSLFSIHPLSGCERLLVRREHQRTDNTSKYEK